MKIIVAVLLVVLATPANADNTPTPGATTLDGVFTTAQVQRGKSAYTRNCSGCHSGNLQGEGIEPPLIGDLFLDAWREDKLFSLYDFMQTRMPKEGRNTSPGSLAKPQYLDILTYLLDRNGFPAGPQELTQEQLTTTQFVGLNGPAPLPSSAMVRWVGCLQVNDKNVQLTQASGPTRVTVIDETDEREIAQSKEAALGASAIALTNVPQLQSVAALAALAHKKVQAKGVLNVASGVSSVQVLSLVSTGQDCSTVGN